MKETYKGTRSFHRRLSTLMGHFRKTFPSLSSLSSLSPSSSSRLPFRLSILPPAAVLVEHYTMLLSSLAWVWALVKGRSAWMRVGTLLYALWSLAWDRAPRQGGRYVRGFTRWCLFRWTREYFSPRVVVEEKLDASQRYIVGVHPHSPYILSFWHIFANDGVQVREKLGIDYRCLGASFSFRLPVTREILMWRGLVDASEDSMRNCLRSGVSVIDVIGGSRESSYAKRGTSRIILDRRKGFIRVALEEGAHLVPCFVFGEGDALDTYQSPLIESIQHRLRKIIGFAPAIVHGIFPLLPFRVPMTAVFGRPILVPRISQPSQEEIDHYHTLYRTALIELHARYRDQYEHPPHAVGLEIVE